MDATVKDLRGLLRERHRLQGGMEDDFTIATPKQAMKMASKISSSFTLFLVLVSAISLVVGAIVIANIMFIGVNERRAEIGIRRAVGARKTGYSRSISRRITFHRFGRRNHWNHSGTPGTQSPVIIYEDAFCVHVATGSFGVGKRSTRGASCRHPTGQKSGRT